MLKKLAQIIVIALLLELCLHSRLKQHQPQLLDLRHHHTQRRMDLRV